VRGEAELCGAAEFYHSARARAGYDDAPMPQPSSRPERFQPNPRVRLRELADEAVLLDLESGTYYGLNATGRRVWELLAGGHSLTATLATMESELEVSAATLRADVEALLSDLERAGLLARID
jgi:hypothetical protein